MLYKCFVFTGRDAPHIDFNTFVQKNLLIQCLLPQLQMGKIDTYYYAEFDTNY